MSSENSVPKESPSEVTPVTVHDPVNAPQHYRQGAVECIDAIRSALGDEGFMDYCTGNAIKYLFRWRHKNGIEDLQKSAWYVNRIIETFKNA